MSLSHFPLTKRPTPIKCTTETTIPTHNTIIHLDSPHGPLAFVVRTNRPTQRFNLHVSTISPIPKSYPIAFRDPNWYRAMLDEYTALIKNNTWILVPRPPDANIVRSIWLFWHKYNADGTLSRYKARLVANGSTSNCRQGADAAYLLLYVDDIVLTASSSDLLQQIITSLHAEFSMTDLGLE
ncbi:ribonuclease H-like domain-containing protein [Tanacetum coccineum]